MKQEAYSRPYFSIDFGKLVEFRTSSTLFNSLVDVFVGRSFPWSVQPLPTLEFSWTLLPRKLNASGLVATRSLFVCIGTISMKAFALFLLLSSVT